MIGIEIEWNVVIDVLGKPMESSERTTMSYIERGRLHCWNGRRTPIPFPLKSISNAKTGV
jgi:hypothetical protein